MTNPLVALLLRVPIHEIRPLGEERGSFLIEWKEFRWRRPLFPWHAPMRFDKSCCVDRLESRRAMDFIILEIFICSGYNENESSNKGKNLFHSRFHVSCCNSEEAEFLWFKNAFREFWILCMMYGRRRVMMNRTCTSCDGKVSDWLSAWNLRTQTNLGASHVSVTVLAIYDRLIRRNLSNQNLLSLRDKWVGNNLLGSSIFLTQTEVKEGKDSKILLCSQFEIHSHPKWSQTELPW